MRRGLRAPFARQRRAVLERRADLGTLYAHGVRQSEWSYEMTGTVETDLERVVAWWFHADRSEEQREQFGLFAAGEVSLEQSVVDGVRIRDFRWKSRQGRHLHHHIETTLTDDGTPAREGDRFVVPRSLVFTSESPSGPNMTRACNGRIEFIEQVDGTTEIRFTHQHTLVGGNRIEQWSHRRSERATSARSFRKTVAQCQAELG